MNCRLSFSLIALLCFLGCSSVDCPVNNTVSTLYNIYDADGAELSLSDTLTVTSVKSNGSDTVLLNKAIGVSAFHLPISYSHPEDVLVFYLDNNTRGIHLIDTVWVKKEDIPHFESVDCNASFFHKITDVRHTTNALNLIEINNPSVTYDTETVNFNVSFKTLD